MSFRDSYLRGLRARLERWSIEIDELERRAGRLAGSAQLRAEERLADLRRQRVALRQLAARMAEARVEQLDDLKHRCERSARALAEALERARIETI
ncbi:MAG TPA: hypothetical protein VLW45_09195 [Pelomicrobium sp.]|nr:hypothetical protein [Pelomicrobium sp.]